MMYVVARERFNEVIALKEAEITNEIQALNKVLKRDEKCTISDEGS